MQQIRKHGQLDVSKILMPTFRFYFFFHYGLCRTLDNYCGFIFFLSPSRTSSLYPSFLPILSLRFSVVSPLVLIYPVPMSFSVIKLWYIGLMCSYFLCSPSLPDRHLNLALPEFSNHVVLIFTRVLPIIIQTLLKLNILKHKSLDTQNYMTNIFTVQSAVVHIHAEILLMFEGNLFWYLKTFTLCSPILSTTIECRLLPSGLP